MAATEIIQAGYVEALLRATLLLGDDSLPTPVRKITISGFITYNKTRKLYPRCEIFVHPELPPDSIPTASSSVRPVDYLILYPIRSSMPPASV